MSIKKYTNNAWADIPYKKYETATDTITSLPKTIIGDGQPISSYAIKGNMQQSGTPTPSNPIYPQEVGDLVTTGEHAGEYKIPILSNGNTYPIYLSEPIRKIGDSVDTAPSTGTATRNIYKLVLTGNEGWTQNGNYPQFYMSFSAPEYNVVTSASIVTTISSHFKGVPTGNVGTAYNICPRSNGSGLFISYGTLSNVTEFVTFLQQQYAAGTPVTVWYVLATATTETFTAPTLPTSGTAQSFDVSTTLKPSEVSLTWHGWHEHTDTKYSNP